MKRQASKPKQFRLMDKPRDSVELVDLWRAGFAWGKGQASQIVTVVYYPAGVATDVRVKAVHCPDGTTSLRCPICGELCLNLDASRRGLSCGTCIEWLEKPS